jgi:osmotically inducible lipoprotein OsmB
MARSGRFALLVIIAAAIAGCSTPLTTREKGAIAGGAVGAGAGAAIGSASGNAATGALIGAGVGVVGGALIGDAMQSAEQQPAPPVAAPPPPPPQPVRVVVASPPPVVVQSPRYVWVPEWGVYVLEGHDIVYADGYHYYAYEGHWYIAQSYTGPWAVVGVAPPSLAAVPRGHFHKKLPPGLAKKGMVPPGHMR